MKLNTLCCAVVGATTLLTASNLFATVYTGKITLSLDYGNANTGGAFKAVTSSLGTFDTFCLNEGVPFTPGVTYDFITGPEAIPGGSPSSDPISIGTAWLFSQFSHNVVGFYGTAQIANDIQSAIWWLEGDSAGARNGFIDLAETALGFTGVNKDSLIAGDANGAYGVFAINMYDANGSRNSPNKQPMLGIVPEPSTVIAGALLLLPFGVSTIRILRKNKNA
jgi:hypothetical protein